MSKDEAKAAALKTEIINPIVGGAVMGGILGGVMGIPSAMNSVADFSALGSEERLKYGSYEIVEKGLTFGKETTAYKNAQKLRQSLKVTDFDLGMQTILNRIEEANTRSYVSRLGEMTGTKVSVGETNPYANAEVRQGENGNEIIISKTADEPIAELIRHEITHIVELTAKGNYDKYGKQLRGTSVRSENERTNGGTAAAWSGTSVSDEIHASYDNAVERTKELYTKAGKKISNQTAESEVAADIARNFMKDGRALDRVQRLADGNLRFTDRMHSALKNLRAKMKALGGAEFVDEVTGARYSYTDIRKAEQLFEYALAETVRNNARNGGTAAKTSTKTSDMPDTKYSIRTDDNGNTFVNIDEDILDGVPEKDWFNTVKNVMRDKFGKGIDYNGENIAVSGKSRGKFTNSDYTRNMTSDERADKFRMANNLDEIINTQSSIKGEEPKHIRKDDIIGFERGKSTIKIGEKEFVGDVVLAQKADNTKQFYDIVNLMPIKIQHSFKSGRTNAITEDRNSAVSDNSISRPDKDVKEKFLLKRSIEEVDKYNYGELLKKKDMPVTMLTEEIPYKSAGVLDRDKLLDIAIDNVRQYTNNKNTDRESFIYVKDIDRDIIVSKKGLRHGLRRNFEDTAKVTMQIGDILENAIAVNELKPRENTEGGYVLMGIGADNKGNYYPTRIIVNDYEVSDVEPLGVVYAINAKKRTARSTPQTLPLNSVTSNSSLSTITIADFLRVVKDNFADTLSQNVLDEYGIQRPKSSLSDSVMYSLKKNPPTESDLRRAQNREDIKEYGISVNKLVKDIFDETGIQKNRRNEAAEESVRNALRALKDGNEKAAFDELSDTFKDLYKKSRAAL